MLHITLTHLCLSGTLPCVVFMDFTNGKCAYFYGRTSTLGGGSSNPRLKQEITWVLCFCLDPLRLGDLQSDMCYHGNHRACVGEEDLQV